MSELNWQESVAKAEIVKAEVVNAAAVVVSANAGQTIVSVAPVVAGSAIFQANAAKITDKEDDMRLVANEEDALHSSMCRV